MFVVRTGAYPRVEHLKEKKSLNKIFVSSASQTIIVDTISALPATTTIRNTSVTSSVCNAKIHLHVRFDGAFLLCDFVVGEIALAFEYAF
jgi:hypothetical protein